MFGTLLVAAVRAETKNDPGAPRAIAQWVRWAASVDQLELRNPPELIRRVLTTMGLAGTLHMTP